MGTTEGGEKEEREKNKRKKKYSPRNGIVKLKVLEGFLYFHSVS